MLFLVLLVILFFNDYQLVVEKRGWQSFDSIHVDFDSCSNKKPNKTKKKLAIVDDDSFRFDRFLFFSFRLVIAALLSKRKMFFSFLPSVHP